MSAVIASASMILNFILPLTSKEKSPKSFCLETIWAKRGLQIQSLALQIAIVPPHRFLKPSISELEAIPAVDNQSNADRQ